MKRVNNTRKIWGAEGGGRRWQERLRETTTIEYKTSPVFQSS